jgi:hypothetical protein
VEDALHRERPLLREASGELKRTGGKPAKVKAHWVWVKPQLELSAEILDEAGDIVVVMPKTNDAIVFSGINVFERDSVTITPE